MSELNLTPPPGNPTTRPGSEFKPKKSSVKTGPKPPNQSLDIDDSGSNSSDNTTPRLQLTPFQKKVKKQTDTTRQENQQLQNRNKQITRNFRNLLFFHKVLYPQLNTLRPTNPLQTELANLRSGRPLSFFALKILLVHMLRLGVDIHKIDRLALDNPESPSIRLK